MWPSTPLSVNSGMKPTIMIAAEKKIARLTSVAARKIVASFPLRPEGAAIPAAPLRGAPSARCRKMFSTMMTLASTMRPKSIAPTERRLADSPRNTRMLIAKKFDLSDVKLQFTYDLTYCRPDQLVAIDFAGRAPGRDRRLGLILQRRQLAKPIQDLLLREMVRMAVR